ncbi:MAG TPA: SGNH/GDSL hydrolase family protein, partial [Pyrinomonadaceae bacterium]|nr:SGNH/GDSL hydrolase family protein [Pyrinomonadaceae bacterium]
MAEVALRIVGYSYTNFYTPDLERGNALRPNAEGWYRKEGTTYVLINSQGLRDREHTKEKPPNTVRIAVLGDSYAEALQVPMENAFWAVMEKKLEGCPEFAGKSVEVINFGVSGYGTAQELITLQKQVWDYSPDIVLLAVTTNNDITDNSRALKRTDEIPYFIYQDDQLTLDNSFQKTSAFRWRQSFLSGIGRWMTDHLRVVQAFIEIQRAVKTRIAAAREQQQATTTGGGAGNEAAAADEIGIDNLIYREPEEEVWKDAWRV